MKKEIVEQVRKDKAKLKARKVEIASLSKEERNIADAKERQIRKEKKQQRKMELKSLPRKERRAAKRSDKMYKKVKNRPIRFTSWTIVAILVIFLVVQIGPTVANLTTMLSGKDITVVSDTQEAVKKLEYDK